MQLNKQKYCRDVETSVKCLDVSHSEFKRNSTNTDEAIFMEIILAPEVAPEMPHINQLMRGQNLLEKLNKRTIRKRNEDFIGYRQYEYKSKY